MTTNFILTKYNAAGHDVYTLIDAEGKLTEPKFLHLSKGFQCFEDTKTQSKAISKSRSRAKARLAKQFGACEVVSNSFVNSNEVQGSDYEFLDTSKRFRNAETTESAESIMKSAEQLAWEEVVAEFQKIEATAACQPNNKLPNREVGYLLEVAVKAGDWATTLYFGSYNTVGTTVESVCHRTYGHMYCRWFTGKMIDKVKSLLHKAPFKGEPTDYFNLSVVEVAFSEDGKVYNVEFARDCREW